jgi:propanediol dehydratase large subunit
MLAQRLSGDYLQTAAVLDHAFHILSAVNDSNDYAGPGTGYRVLGERRAEIGAIRQARDPHRVPAISLRWPGPVLHLEDGSVAVTGATPGEVVLAVGPAFGRELDCTLAGITHGRVLREVLAGLEEEGAPVRVMRVRDTSDVAFIALTAARLSGSGIGIGIQSKGTTVIHQRALPPLSPLELFSVAPLMTPDHYRAIGRNAARYARGEHPEPVLLDHQGQAIEARYHTKAAAFHHVETRQIVHKAPPVELLVELQADVSLTGNGPEADHVD